MSADNKAKVLSAKEGISLNFFSFVEINQNTNYHKIITRRLGLILLPVKPFPYGDTLIKRPIKLLKLKPP